MRVTVDDTTSSMKGVLTAGVYVGFIEGLFNINEWVLNLPTD